MTGIHRAALLLALLVFTALANLVHAQDVASGAEREQNPWEATATRAEAVINAGRASNAALEKLRRDLVEYREQFLRARDQNQPRIRSVQAQLNALGPKPETGEEVAEIASYRKELTDELNRLTIPNIIAEKRFFRANGLIGQIDRIERDRRLEQLLARGPSPFNPALWPDALRGPSRVVAGIWQEIVRHWTTQTARVELARNAPLIGALLLVGLLLLIRGGAWADQLGNYLRGFGGRGTGVWTFIVSLAKVFLPLTGIAILCEAASIAGLFGLRGSMVLEVLPAWGATILVFKWLADQLYGDHRNDRLLPLATNNRTEAWYLTVLLGAILVLHQALNLFERLDDHSELNSQRFGLPADRRHRDDPDPVATDRDALPCQDRSGGRG